MQLPAEYRSTTRTVLARLIGCLSAVTLLSTATLAASPRDIAQEAPEAARSPAGNAGGAFPSSYRPVRSPDVAIINATILTAAGPAIERGTVLVSANRIKAVGRDLAVPPDTKVIDAAGKWITPGIIDGHSHAGGVSIPYATLADGGNEITDPNTAQILIEHALWAQNPEFPALRAAGVTSLLVLPGSGNIFGGRGVVLKNVPANTVQGMKFPNAPYTLKMACGENPTRVYGPKGRSPMTRAGVVSIMRSAFLNAADYGQKRQRYEAGLAGGQGKSGRSGKGNSPGEPPKRDLQAEAIAGVIDHSTKLAVHCYRAEDMAVIMDVGHEFGFTVTGFHHATEAFKIIPELLADKTCIMTWGPDWGGFKAEAYDHSDLTVAMLAKAGVCVAVTSDSIETGQHLNVDAARSMAAGNEAGLAIDRAEAIRWITINPANALGIADQTGSIEVGKMADLVVWNRDPFSVYAHPERVFIDGAETFVRGDPKYRRSTDLELDQPATLEDVQ